MGGASRHGTLAILAAMTASLIRAQAAAAPVPGAGLRASSALAGAQPVTWTLRLPTPYCGGYRVGDGVHLQLPPGFPQPRHLTARFAAGPAVLVRRGLRGWRIAPAPGRIWAQLCLRGSLPLVIVVHGLRNPSRPGTYPIRISTGASAQRLLFPLRIIAPATAQAPRAAPGPAPAAGPGPACARDRHGRHPTWAPATEQRARRPRNEGGGRRAAHRRERVERASFGRPRRAGPGSRPAGGGRPSGLWPGAPCACSAQAPAAAWS